MKRDFGTFDTQQSKNSPSEQSARSAFVVAAWWFGVLVGIYLFCMGPAARWFPEAAEFIYAPMSVVADWPVLGPAMRGWISLWGVDVGE